MPPGKANESAGVALSVTDDRVTPADSLQIGWGQKPTIMVSRYTP
ncbi:hypothetical protein SAMN06296010_2255 [Agreia pratensis]|uniref:Uncharacterized protein n=1 Tax=Agreia pratensis TaxID=150121 RepID=A0A1X7K9P8_9MICO|nr:hypothetical protein SAMN06296010_2255 [Agreia pratensis]